MLKIATYQSTFGLYIAGKTLFPPYNIINNIMVISINDPITGATLILIMGIDRILKQTLLDVLNNEMMKSWRVVKTLINH